MRKGRGLKRAVPIVAQEELHAMPTKQLLGRLKRLRYCEDSLEGSDLLEHEVESCTGILFKSTPEWKNAYDELKRVLATREHIPAMGMVKGLV